MRLFQTRSPESAFDPNPRAGPGSDHKGTTSLRPAQPISKVTPPPLKSVVAEVEEMAALGGVSLLAPHCRPSRPAYPSAIVMS